ncbi:VOC family protein [Streptomyces sp. SPB074]|uniref:VOC family protein n=1 Tax=Streptomyces sp. (strain SPB074) TaxID=465543 RepID=UPI00056444D8|nr:VOC family protein [Streptomyces sp. SPB074]
MPAHLRPVAVTLDCADPLALAAFYRRVTGFAPHPESGAGFAALTGPDGFVLGFQAVEDYRPPRWPGQEVPQQVHLCYEVDEDLAAAETRLLALGAVLPAHQPHDPARARVLTDPAGHPFCVVRKKAEG